MARILVVEDNRLNLELVRDVLLIEGHDVDAVENGQAAVEQAELLRPDLILMDLQLPGMDGLTATRILKSKAETATTPIVALTAHASAVDRERAKEAGCNGYIAKPIQLDSFADTINEFLVHTDAN